MRLTADTNVLVRAAVDDDPEQAALARAQLQGADSVALTTRTLCELVWVLSQGYKIKSADIAAQIRLFVCAANAATDAQAVTVGLAALDAGGDFADAVIAFEGRRLGADEFVSFDRRAVALLKKQGVAARLLT
ncbi:MAG: type II toxin-antitoxin system VapC family toxin [Hyphomonadaceae bacterium]|nr:type II toxin-antitoxin system VapC family toxin [Hyphomonadaceae bacterium]